MLRNSYIISPQILALAGATKYKSWIVVSSEAGLMVCLPQTNYILLRQEQVLITVYGSLERSRLQL